MDSAGKWLVYLAVAAAIGGVIVIAASMAGAAWNRLSGRGPAEAPPQMPPTEKVLFYGVFKVAVAVVAAIPATMLVGMVFSRVHKARNLLDVVLAALDFLAFAIYMIIPIIFAYFYIHMGKGWRQAVPVAVLLLAVTLIYWLVAIAFRPDQSGSLFIVAFLTPYLAGPPLIARRLRARPPLAASGPGNSL